MTTSDRRRLNKDLCHDKARLVDGEAVRTFGAALTGANR